MSLLDWASLERKWQEQWERFAVGHVCSNCGALVNVMDASWRWTGNGYEHKCPGIDAQAGHFPAVKRAAPIRFDAETTQGTAPTTARVYTWDDFK